MSWYAGGRSGVVFVGGGGGAGDVGDVSDGGGAILLRFFFRFSNKTLFSALSAHARRRCWCWLVD